MSRWKAWPLIGVGICVVNAIIGLLAPPSQRATFFAWLAAGLWACIAAMPKNEA